MSDWDAVIIGGGPAGLTAGLYLCRGNYRTILLEKESFGGYVMNIAWIENFPGFTEGVMGSQLGMEMRNQATKYGLQMKRSEVSTIQDFPGNKWVITNDGGTYTAPVVIIAGGSKPKKLGVNGEDMFMGKGVFHCAFCDGSQYTERIVAVCGGGDAGVSEALYMTRLASKVILIEALPELTATAVLRDRARETPNLEVRCGVRVDSIAGENQVEAIELAETETGKKETLKVDGVLVHVGLDPDTDYLDGIVPQDSRRQIIVNISMETEVPGIFAAGDIRSGSPGQVATAAGDGAIAGISAQKYLQSLK